MDWKQTVAGGGAGLIEAVLMHPADTIKTRLQARHVAGRVYTGPMDVVTSIWHEEGFRTFYRGLGPVINSVVPRVALQVPTRDQ
jgi:hypothetical protein